MVWSDLEDIYSFLLHKAYAVSQTCTSTNQKGIYNISKHYYFLDTALLRNCSVPVKYGAESSQGAWRGQLFHSVLLDGQHLPSDCRYDTSVLSHLFLDALLLRGSLERTVSAWHIGMQSLFLLLLKHMGYLFCMLQPAILSWLQEAPSLGESPSPDQSFRPNSAQWQSKPSSTLPLFFFFLFLSCPRYQRCTFTFVSH